MPLANPQQCKTINLDYSRIEFARLPRPFRARNDIVKIYIAFILV
jgi:hypothetical protein